MTYLADLRMNAMWQGVAPWEIEYSVVGQRTRTISDITKSPYAFDIQIPASIAKHGGQFALSLGTSRLLLPSSAGSCPDRIRLRRRQRASKTGIAAAGRSPQTISLSRFGVRNRRRASTALKDLGPCSSAMANLQRSHCVSAESE